MSSLLTALIAFCCVFTSAMVGLWLRAVLPEHHLDDDSRDIVKLGTGALHRSPGAGLAPSMGTSLALHGPMNPGDLKPDRAEDDSARP